jgi:hypothetical protein
MKKVILPLFLLSFIIFNAQINITSTTSPKKQTLKITTKSVYDSSYNFPGKKIQLIIGQRLFVKPKPVDLRKNGYLKFIINPNKSEFATPNIYSHSKGISSDYDALANRYFLLKNVIKTKFKKQALVLLDSKMRDTVYFIYDAKNSQLFPFLIEGYFKKLENASLGKKYILRQLETPPVYITSGFEAVSGEEKLWEIDKVTLDDKLYKISYILKDDMNNKILVYKDDFEKTALSEADYNLIKNKYPNKYKIILNENVIVGMTKEACKYALGVPDKVNYSSNLEQWIYKNITLYLKDGLLSSYK